VKNNGMIKTRQDLLFYLEADRIHMGKPKSLSMVAYLKQEMLPDLVWDFMKTLRNLEYLNNNPRSVLNRFKHFILLKRYRKLSYKLGFTIPLNVFGPGLSIAHHGTIIINTGAKIGANCRIHCDVNIGTEAGYSNKAPQIGNNVYIGPGAKLFGDITIADNAVIGANAVVNKSFLEPNTVIAGIPAQVIKSNIDIHQFIVPADLIAKKYSNHDFSGLTSTEINSKLKQLSK
jgi:serine O-acetyltransferase